MLVCLVSALSLSNLCFFHVFVKIFIELTDVPGTVGEACGGSYVSQSGEDSLL